MGLSGQYLRNKKLRFDRNLLFWVIGFGLEGISYSASASTNNSRRGNVVLDSVTVNSIQGRLSAN